MPDKARAVKLSLLLLFFLHLSAKTTVTLHNHLATAFQFFWQLKQGLLKRSDGRNTRRKSIISNKITKTVTHSNSTLSCCVYPLTMFYILPLTSVNEGIFLMYYFSQRITAAAVLRSICTHRVCYLLNTSWPNQVLRIFLHDNYAFKDFLQRWSLRGKARVWRANPPYCMSCCDSNSVTGPIDLHCSQRKDGLVGCNLNSAGRDG